MEDGTGQTSCCSSFHDIMVEIVCRCRVIIKKSELKPLKSKFSKNLDFIKKKFESQNFRKIMILLKSLKNIFFF